jgi:hypothetical protein
MTTGTTTTTLTPAQQTYSAELDAIEARSRLVIGEGVGGPKLVPRRETIDLDCPGWA